MKALKWMTWRSCQPRCCRVGLRELEPRGLFLISSIPGRRPVGFGSAILGAVVGSRDSVSGDVDVTAAGSGLLRAPAKSDLHFMIVCRGRLDRRGVVAQGGGDAGSAGEPQDSDGQVTQGCHDLRPAGRVDLGAVLIEVQVADGVAALDGDLSAAASNLTMQRSSTLRTGRSAWTHKSASSRGASDLRRATSTQPSSR
jgi:hypothetical protein